MYRVNDIYPALQGEGVLSGVPMVILRLHGCEVGCPFCDTRETWSVAPENRVETIDAALGANALWCEVDARDVASYIAHEYPQFVWVMVTGGEPAAQDLRELVQALHERGLAVALETSGTQAGFIGAGVDWVCVSPKIGMPGGFEILPEVIAQADEIKHVVGRQRDIERLEELLRTCEMKRGAMVCLQPMSTGEAATKLCIETVMSRGDWRLSLQTHKLVGLR